MKFRILIVDDNKKLCSSLKDILEFKGYAVEGVFSGEEAVEAVKKNRFNVILLDVKMPGMSGIETLKKINSIQPDANIIFITAFSDDLFYKEKLEKGDYKIIQKPVDIDTICDMIENIKSSMKN